MKIETVKKIQMSSMYGKFNAHEPTELEKDFELDQELNYMILEHLPEKVNEEKRDNDYYDDIERTINLSLGRYYHQAVLEAKASKKFEGGLLVPMPTEAKELLKKKYMAGATVLSHIGNTLYYDDDRANRLFTEAVNTLTQIINKDTKYLQLVSEHFRKYFRDYKMLCDLIKESRNSDDPHTQVAAIIADDKFKISSGVNKMPNGTRGLPLEREGDYLDTKYPYIVHAEVNAIINAYTDEEYSLDDKTMYVSLFPCNECAKMIIQSGITEVVYWERNIKIKTL